MKRVMVALAVALATSGCSTKFVKPHDYDKPEQRAYIEKAAKQYPAETGKVKLQVPKAKSVDAWGRAQTVVARNSISRIQAVSDFVLSTYDFAATKAFGWNISRAPGQDGDDFFVSCSYTEERYGPKDGLRAGEIIEKSKDWYCQANRSIDNNASVAARFIATGESVPDKTIWPEVMKYQIAPAEWKWYNPLSWWYVEGELYGDGECAK